MAQSKEQTLHSDLVLWLDSFVCVHDAQGSVQLCVVQRGRKRRELRDFKEVLALESKAEIKVGSW